MNNSLKTLSFWLFIFVVVIMLVNYFNLPKTAGNKQYTYGDFIQAVEHGDISKVTIIQKEQSVKEISGVRKDNTEFKLVAPNDDPLLFQALHAQHVDITSKTPQTSGMQWLATFFFSWGPVIAFIAFWLYYINKMQGGAGGAMAFGKSRAKLQTPTNKPKVTFADVAGVDEAKQDLEEIIDFLKDPTKFQRLGGKIPKGVLLLGPPGTGKTLLARAVAGEAGVPFFSISGSDFVEMFVGVGASRVRDLFEQGKKNAPCIIFIDEIDAVGRHRGAGLGGGHDEREQTLNALLVEMDGFEANTGVIMIAATNRPDVLDPALLRPGRFDRQIVVDRPDLNGRAGVLKVHTKSITLGDDVDLQVLARRTPGFSGADLANLANEAALLAARRGKKSVTMSEMEEAIERVLAGPERKSRVISEREKKVIAVHESGHALVARLIPGTNPVHKMSIIPRGRGALGYTLQLPIEDRFLAMREELLNEISVLVAGRAAEQLIFNEISTGAANDLERATDIAHRMVCEYGMSKELGTLTYGKKDHEVFLGRDLLKEKNYSEETAQAIDLEVRKIVTSAYERSQLLLKKNQGKLEKLAHTLQEKEVIVSEEIDQILHLKTPAVKNPKG
ncbi:MAG: ATP-dependent metallopeptidase FtsH/Yme1/Tma family protein [Candidatus Firestonebacteria bacterium]|nr:ATP-dependent metallopeptidase FtsH/Yme1/Tma family protein [Candidatus Firestonebacteria bacterium]